ncbi:MAG: hypothetical protein ACLP7F_13095 [Acidimicrobiales bacterium]
MKKLLSALAVLAVLVPALPANAAPKSKVLYSWTGANGSVRLFTIPAADSSWRLSWSFYSCNTLYGNEITVQLYKGTLPRIALLPPQPSLVYYWKWFSLMVTAKSGS